MILLAISLTALALIYPPAFTWGKDLIPYLLGVIMFGMGLTLSKDDFAGVWGKRRSLLVGVSAQYLVMPLLAVILSFVLGLPEAFAIGMILVGACPGGTASNVITYISKGNVAYSVTMTACSTLLSPVLTPLLVYVYAREMINVSLPDMFLSIVWIIILPLGIGLLLHRFFKEPVRSVVRFMPLVSVLGIAFIIAIIMALNQKLILTFPALVVTAVILHNLLGLLCGYLIGRAFSMDEADCRTLAIEVGMQNSGLGVSLATTFFTAQAALPGAIFSLWHNVSGLVISRYWDWKSGDSKTKNEYNYN